MVFALSALLVGWFAYRLIVYALPGLAGLIVAQWAFDAGAGPLGSLIVWGAVSGAILGFVRWLYRAVREPELRSLLALAFATPPAVVGYFLFDDLSMAAAPSELWRQALRLAGATSIGLIAFARLGGGR